MNKQLKSYLIILGHLIIGLSIIVSIQQLKLPTWLSASVLILLAFVFLNLTHFYFFKLRTEIREFWSIRKIAYLPIGIIGGGLIAISPTFLALISGQLSISDISFNSDLSITSIGLTFVIIAWEELWFRGIFLNYCNRYLSAINLSLTIGLLFMLVHLLNPKIDLLKTGPTLFFAGALLTILYFYFKTIWLPVGLHFGNNFTGTILKTSNETDIMFGTEGYIGTIVLAGLFLIFVKMTIDKNKNGNQKYLS
ncbi:MAG: CPBP family intramembrane metalloprotease [Flavobacteriales bacterium]|nr:CPBP family intramembrane metalloprotease [Flavobacteriales bacterium]